MKTIFSIVFFLCAIATNAQTIKDAKVEASCGQCLFGMKKGGCDLAVRIDGKPYFVDGVKLDDHGDAHAADGFCSAIRMANVSGEIVGDRFKSSSFELLPADKKSKK